MRRLVYFQSINGKRNLMLCNKHIQTEFPTNTNTKPYKRKPLKKPAVPALPENNVDTTALIRFTRYKSSNERKSRHSCYIDDNTLFKNVSAH